MIVSHKYRFIFVKGRKVAGTSVEIALAKFLGDADIVPRLLPEDEELRRSIGHRPPQNHLVPSARLWRDVLTFRAAGRSHLKEIIFARTWPRFYYGHMPATEVKAAVGEAVWRSYFKFAVERNPFDKVASLYFWSQRNKSPGTRRSFAEFVEAGYGANASDYDLYSVNRVPAMDRFVRYENLLDELDDVGRLLGLPEPLSGLMRAIRAKDGHRDKGAVAELYSNATRSLVELQFAREIRHFGHGFPEASERPLERGRATRPVRLS